MRILVAGQTYSPILNGQAIFTTNLSNGLAQRGHEVVVIAPSYGEESHSAECTDVQIEPIRSIHLKVIHPDVYLTLPADGVVRRVINSFRPNVVHIHDHYLISLTVLKYARRQKVKVLGTNHFMPENLAPYFPLPKRFKVVFEKALWWWMLRTFNRLDMVTAPSKTAATILRNRGLKVPVYPISCGVDTKRFRPLTNVDRNALRNRYGLDSQKTLFLFVGRVDGEKRIDLLLRALHLLDRDDIQLAVAGRGAARPGLIALAKELNLGDRVRFTGFVPNEDLPALLNSADIFVMPSEAELLSIASLEAMACGRPILLARAWALPELVNDGINGYLFQPGDVQDVATYMTILADHPERWKSMGAASLEKVRQHSIENTLCSYEKLYETLAITPLPRPEAASVREPVGKRASKTASQTQE